MSNETRNHLEDFDYRAFPHTVSASQLETFLTCPRKWWFSKCARLPELQDQQKFVFGDRLHEACERWLRADDQGRDENGEPVNIWPEGWDRGLSNFDASLIKRLVQSGIDEGVLRRTPGRQIEAPIGTHNGRNYTPLRVTENVGAAGYRDVKIPGGIEDHKSVKSRRYMKTQDGLLSDPQMLFYAGIEMIELFLAKEGMPSHITIRHNQFVKDPNDLHVSACEVEAPVEMVQEFWEKAVQPAADKMARYKKGTRDPNRWGEIDGPKTTDACRKYGGCPFSRICGRAEQPAAYTARIQRINAQPTEDPNDSTTTSPGEDIMGIFDRKPTASTPAATVEKPKAKEPKAKAPEAKALKQVEIEPAPMKVRDAKDTVPYAELPDTPPWANDKCKGCSGTGFNSKGGACAACDRVAEKKGNPRASAFAIETDDDGYTSWTRLADDTIMGVTRLQTAEVTAAEKTKPVTKAKETKAAKKRSAFAKNPSDDTEENLPNPDTPAAVVAKVSDVEIDSQKTTGVTRGRPKGGFTLVYGGVRRSKPKLLDLNEVFGRYAQELADALNVPSFYLIDRFKRRDMMCSKAKAVAESIPSNTIVVVRADDPDIRPFATALEIYATTVIEGVS